VLAIQYGYMPGLLWLVIGVCLAGAVQDMLVLAASVRRGGKSLAEIARTELGKPASIVVSAAILFIVVIALAGLGFVVVKALGGETFDVAGAQFLLPPGTSVTVDEDKSDSKYVIYRLPDGCLIRDSAEDEKYHRQPEGIFIRLPRGQQLVAKEVLLPGAAALGVPV